MIKRFVIIVLDGAGIGQMPDAGLFGDAGANTIGNVFKEAGENFELSNLASLGLYNLLPKNLRNPPYKLYGSFAKLITRSEAKDTTAGHWEISGIVLPKPFPTYPNGFPNEVIEKFEKTIGVKTLGNCTASGIEIIQRLGDEHIKTGCPIIYTSADSVFQIACHEKYFGLDRLYKISLAARSQLIGKHSVSRVIARPFIGENGAFTRTSNRKDFSLDPIEATILDSIKSAGGEVVGIGKIEDIFNARGLTRSMHTGNNKEGMYATLKAIADTSSKTMALVFVNLVDFDMQWGHRRNVKAFADGLKDFDDFIPDLLKSLNEDDMLFITADHGCDPTMKRHTDHTREFVPLLVYSKQANAGVNLGIRDSLADIAQSIADGFGLQKMKNGKSFLKELFCQHGKF